MTGAPVINFDTIANYGLGVVLLTIVISFIVYYIWKVWPEDKRYQRQLQDTMTTQMALSIEVIRSNSTVVAQNSEMLKETQSSHQRIGERLECLETDIGAHDKRAEGMSRDITAIKTKVGA